MIDKQYYITLQEITDIFSIDRELCKEFIDFGLIRAYIKKNITYIKTEELSKLKRVISLYKKLGVNKEGIEIILSMRDQIIELQNELQRLKYQVNRFEKEYRYKNIEIPKDRGLFFEL